MEIGECLRPSPVHVVKPPEKQRTAPEAWREDDFHNRLTSSQEIAYCELPPEIYLSESWHTLLNRLMRNTHHDGVEWSFEVACLDQKGQLLSSPLSIESHFRDRWGPHDNPLFVSHLAQGSEYRANAYGIPAVIEWDGESMAVKRAAFIHTHPNDTPFSRNDVRWFVQNHREEKGLFAVTESFNYMLLRTDAIPEYVGQNTEKQTTTKDWLAHLRRLRQNRQSMLDRNIQTAKDLKFGLYRGKPDSPLMRIA